MFYQSKLQNIVSKQLHVFSVLKQAQTLVVIITEL